MLINNENEKYYLGLHIFPYDMNSVYCITFQANHKALKMELKEAQEQIGDITHEKKTLHELKSAINEDREHFKNETKSMGTLQMDLLHLKVARLTSACEGEYSMLSSRLFFHQIFW